MGRVVKKTVPVAGFAVFSAFIFDDFRRCMNLFSAAVANIDFAGAIRCGRGRFLMFRHAFLPDGRWSPVTGRANRCGVIVAIKVPTSLERRPRQFTYAVKIVRIDIQSTPCPKKLNRIQICHKCVKPGANLSIFGPVSWSTVGKNASAIFSPPAKKCMHFYRSTISAQWLTSVIPAESA